MSKTYKTSKSAKHRRDVILHLKRRTPSHDKELTELDDLIPKLEEQEKAAKTAKKKADAQKKEKQQFKDSLKPETYHLTYNTAIWPKLLENVWGKYNPGLTELVKLIKEKVENDPEFKKEIVLAMYFEDGTKQYLPVDEKEATITGFFAQERITKLIQKVVNEIISEPNGKNTFPDWKITYNGGSYYLEGKSTHFSERCQVGINKEAVCVDMIENHNIDTMILPIINVIKKLEERVDEKTGEKYMVMKLVGLRIWPAAMMVNYTNLEYYKNSKEGKNINISSKTASDWRSNEINLYKNGLTFEDCKDILTNKLYYNSEDPKCKHFKVLSK